LTVGNGASQLRRLPLCSKRLDPDLVPRRVPDALDEHQQEPEPVDPQALLHTPTKNRWSPTFATGSGSGFPSCPFAQPALLLPTPTKDRWPPTFPTGPGAGFPSLPFAQAGLLPVGTIDTGE